MLQHLTIRDFVIVDWLELDFDRGFGALTGETGAGKSILIDALALALGGKSDAGVVRSGCDKTEVVARFDISALPDVTEWLQAQDMDDSSDELFLRRVIDSKGRSRAYINGTATPLQQLREVAELLLDIHGQHAHQSLLRPDAQRQLLDSHAGLSAQVRQVNEIWQSWRQAENTLEAAASNSAALQREREQLEWQIQDVGGLAFTLDEWQQLDGEHKRLAHAASLIEGAQFALNILADGEGDCTQQIDSVATRLDDLASYDENLGSVAQLIQSAQTELSEAVSSLRRYVDRVELDPGRLAEVETRIDTIMGCARKYRTTPEALPELLAGWQQRLTAINDSTDLEALEARVQVAKAAYMAVAATLSAGRQQAASALSESVTTIMRQLALSSGALQIALVPLENGSAHGLEQIEFRVSGLSGSESRNLAKVVSGGELSRISLAIQVVTSRSASVPTLIFDEVDVGIGGGVAEIVGRLLHELGSERQVLCVTHLPQVAARANWQWRISKRTEDGTTLSSVEPLDYTGRVEEIARMLGGVEITDITRQHAEELLSLN
jgi:DNA repair protein RecN (Recombination protein N)